MSEAKSVEAAQGTSPPAYYGNTLNQTMASQSSNGKGSRKSKALFGYAVGATTALIVVLIMGGVYYYRSLDVIQESLKKFKVVDDSDKTRVSQDVEIDTLNQYAVFRLNGVDMEPGTFAVLDYAKSLTGLYDPKGRQCFLIAGIRSSIVDLQTLSSAYEKNKTNHVNTTNMENLVYVLADTYPVSDKKILPAPLKNSCTSIPVYWLEPASAEKIHDIQKRGFWGNIWRGIKKGVTWVIRNVKITVHF